MLRVNVITGFIKASMSPSLLRIRDTLSNPRVHVERPVPNQDTRTRAHVKAQMTASSCHMLHSVFNHLHCLQTERDWFKWRMHNPRERQQAIGTNRNQIGPYGFRFYYHWWFIIKQMISDSRIQYVIYEASISASLILLIVVFPLFLKLLTACEDSSIVCYIPNGWFVK